MPQAGGTPTPQGRAKNAKHLGSNYNVPGANPKGPRVASQRVSKNK